MAQYIQDREVYPGFDWFTLVTNGFSCNSSDCRIFTPGLIIIHTCEIIFLIIRLFPNLGVVSRESLYLCSGKYVSGSIKDARFVSLLNLTLAQNKSGSGLGISCESVCLLWMCQGRTALFFVLYCVLYPENI